MSNSMESQPDCPVADVTELHQPFSQTYMNNPFPKMAQARKVAPVFYNPDIGYWIISRYEDIKAILRNHDLFTAENTITPIVPFTDEVKQTLQEGGYTPEPVLSNAVPPKHTRIRSLANKLFVPRQMRKYAPTIRVIITQMIDHFIDKKKVDIVRELTYDFPALVLFELLGVPPEDVPQVKSWATNRIELYYAKPTHDRQKELIQALLPFWKYTETLVQRKLNAPGDDIPTELLTMRNNDDTILSLNEIASCLITLLVAGHETTTAQLTHTIYHLLNQPEYWQTLHQQPELIPNIVEELLRYDPSVYGWRRVAKKATIIAGVDIPANANLLLLLSSANRDDACFSQPDRLDPHRNNTKEHLAFGYGIHYCIGAPLARLEGVIALEELTKRMPTMRLTPNQTLEYLPNISFRSPLSLLVEWD